MMRINCPGCGKLLQCDPGPSGKKIACPSCREVFAVRPPEEAITTVEPIPRPPADDGILDVVPADVEPVGPSSIAYLFARQEGIDLEETFDRQVENEAAALQLLQHWQQEMSEVPSAYQPSGVLPVNALLLMIAGSFVGAGAGLLAGGLVAAVGGAVVTLVGYLIALMLICGVVWCFAVVVGVLFALVVAAGTFVAEGWVSAWCVTRFGHSGKNRNVRAAVLLSVLSSVLAIALACVVYYFVGKPLLAQRGMTEYSDLIAVAVAVVGGAIAALTAGVIAAERVRADKFCEDCEAYMTATNLKSPCLGEMRTLARALVQGRMDVVGSVLEEPAGEDGEVKLFACPSCARGYLEVTAKYKAQWKVKKDTKEKEESWLAASHELAGEDVKRLRETVPD